jgi:parvulin-like peptidyl-prolyl isomerase
LGAVLGLVIAGFGLFTAKGTRSAAVPAEDVAVVNQVPILVSDFIVQLRALYDVSLSEATPEQKRKVLDDMIHEELYVQRGVELGLQSDTVEVRAALVGAVEQQVAADATMTQPDEGTLRAYYGRHAAKYSTEGTLQLEDFRIAPDSRATPAALAAELRHGASAAALEPLGLKRTRAFADGEEFYFAARIHLGDALFDAARDLNPGEVSPPLTAPDGTHLLVMKKNVPPLARPFDEVRGAVLRDFIAEETARLTAGNDRFLRRRADIAIAPGFE